MTVRDHIITVIIGAVTTVVGLIAYDATRAWLDRRRKTEG